MKRDLDLVRKILQWMEAQDQGRNVGWKIEIEDHTDEQIGYHAHLMAQAGLILAADRTYTDSHTPYSIPLSITWAGHEFLAAAASDTIWAKAKEHVLKPAAGATFPVLLEWLKMEAKARLGLP